MTDETTDPKPANTPAADSASTEEAAQPKERFREVRYKHSTHFVPILDKLGATLLVSTYAAGKLAVIGTYNGELDLTFNNFEQAMGVAVSPKQMAVGARGQIWFLENGQELARKIEPQGKYKLCYLTRTSFVTGNIHVHELVWADNELWIVNTFFSCLCTLQPGFSFVPRWQPPFITELQGEDRCHLNGLAVDNGKPRYVTMMAESNQVAGWRETKSTSGLVMDVASGEVVTRGLAMPHSPRIYQHKLWVLNSGLGALETVDLDSGKRTTVETMPGYTRGLAFCGPFAFVGLSRIRETAVFGGVPIAENRDELRCGVAIVDLRSGQSVAYIQFETGIEEIFDVQVVPNIRCMSVTGPFPVHDGVNDVWVLPNPAQIKNLSRDE